MPKLFDVEYISLRFVLNHRLIVQYDHRGACQRVRISLARIFGDYQKLRDQETFRCKVRGVVATDSLPPRGGSQASESMCLLIEPTQATPTESQPKRNDDDDVA